MSGNPILVIEDDEGIRESMRDLLELEGYEVLTAENGAIGLRMMESIDAPCMILLDMMMPVMDGWQFLKALHDGTDPQRARIPVTVVSAAVDIDDVKSRFGCEVMTKPVNIDCLLDAARKVCSCPQAML
jgi:CheY-like chemotaxis protein